MVYWATEILLPRREKEREADSLAHFDGICHLSEGVVCPL